MKGSVAQVLCFYNRLWVFKSEISLFSNTSCCTDCAAQHNTILFFSAKEIFHLKAVPRSPLVGRSAFPPGEVVVLPRGMGKTWPESRIFGHRVEANSLNPTHAPEVFSLKVAQEEQKCVQPCLWWRKQMKETEPPVCLRDRAPWSLWEWSNPLWHHFPALP